MGRNKDIQYKTDKLVTLDLALNPDRMREVLARLAHRELGEQVETEEVKVEIIRQRNQRCVIRYRVQVRDNSEQQAREWRVIGKVYKPHRGERVYQTMLRLWEHGFSYHAFDGISIPKPMDFSSSLCMLFQEEVPGTQLKMLVKQEPRPEHMRRLAQAVAKLHSSPFIPGPPMTIRDHLLRCHPRYPFLIYACPELEKDIDYIVNTAEKIGEQLADIPLAPIHGDLHLGQLHINARHTYLIDFDALSYGDPAADLGNILVFLKGKARKNPEMNQLIEIFLQEYFSRMDESIARRIPLYEALTHLRRAAKLLRYQKEGWRRKVRRMIQQGVERMQQMELS